MKYNLGEVRELSIDKPVLNRIYREENDSCQTFLNCGIRLK